MTPESSFYDYLEDNLRQAGEHEASEGFERRYQAERDDREFVRAALQGAGPEDEIERQLLFRSEFVRLNPDRDPHAYAHGLIDEEKSSFHALSARIPPSLEDTVAGESRQSNPTSQAGTDGEGCPPAVAKRHAIDRAETAEGAPHRSAIQPPTQSNPRAEASEAAVRQYLAENYEPSDRLAVVLRNRESGETIQRMSTAQRIASPEFQAWLRFKNAHGSDIYVSLNAFQDTARGRTKADLKHIRHLYLDLDEDGSRKLEAIHHDDTVPRPNYVLNTSPEKYQVIWKVEGIGQDEAEALLRALAQRFGGDSAATDSTRVFRVPGFANKKYQDDFPVTLTAHAPANQVYHASDFRTRSPVEEHEQPTSTEHPTPRNVAQRDGNSQSEKDWNYAIRKLKAGEDPDKIIRDMAQYRSVDHYDKRDPTKLVAPSKPKPRYYAERTVRLLRRWRTSVFSVKHRIQQRHPHDPTRLQQKRNRVANRCSMRDRAYLFGILTRWVILTVSQASLLFLAAGTTQDLLLWTYLSVFSVLLLATMLIVNPGLAEERAHPGVPAISPGTRVATGVLFLVTLTAAALDSGRLQSGSIPAQLRIAALDLSRSARAFRPGRWPSILSSLRSFVSSRNEDIVP